MTFFSILQRFPRFTTRYAHTHIIPRLASTGIRTPQFPTRFQCGGEVVPGADHVLWQPRDPVRARANGTTAHGGNARVVGPDGARVAAVAAVCVAEARRKGEIEGCEGA